MAFPFCRPPACRLSESPIKGRAASFSLTCSLRTQSEERDLTETPALPAGKVTFSAPGVLSPAWLFPAGPAQAEIGQC